MRRDFLVLEGQAACELVLAAWAVQTHWLPCGRPGPTGWPRGPSQGLHSFSLWLPDDTGWGVTETLGGARTKTLAFSLTFWNVLPINTPWDQMVPSQGHSPDFARARWTEHRKPGPAPASRCWEG